MNEIQAEREMRNDEGKRGGEQKGKRNRGERENIRGSYI
jgi:hypothetical protein